VSAEVLAAQNRSGQWWLVVRQSANAPIGHEINTKLPVEGSEFPAEAMMRVCIMISMAKFDNINPEMN